MVSFNVKGPIVYDEVLNVSKQHPSEEILLILKNTKGQDTDVIESIGKNIPSVKFSVLGGLNPEKEKFNNFNYQNRTYLSAMELAQIIKIFEKIERKIQPQWTETQKAMYVYKKLCNYMTYEESSYNGKDTCRMLQGLIYKKAVCSGFALIFKEAMDRLGFENYYQNRKSRHSWNIVKLDGAYRGLELTWDVYNKGENGCEFNYFNRNFENFYDNEHHDLSNEPEEREFDIVPYTTDQLISDYNTISRPKVSKFPLSEFVDSKNCTKPLSIGDGKVRFGVEDNNIFIQTLGDVKYKKFTRDDGSSFIIIPGQKIEKVKDTFMYNIFEAKGSYVQSTKIFSESNLMNLSDEYNSVIANRLLSTERLKRKVNNFKGYVGYIGNNTIYYDRDFEINELNIIKR